MSILSSLIQCKRGFAAKLRTRKEFTSASYGGVGVGAVFKLVTCGLNVVLSGVSECGVNVAFDGVC